MSVEQLNGAPPAEKPKVTAESIRQGFAAESEPAAPATQAAAAPETPATTTAGPDPKMAAAQERAKYLLQRMHEARLAGDDKAALEAMDELSGIAGMQRPQAKNAAPTAEAQLREVKRQKLLSLFAQGAGEGENAQAIAERQWNNYGDLIKYHIEDTIPQIAQATDELVNRRVDEKLAALGLTPDRVTHLTSRVEADEWKFAADKVGPDAAAKLVPVAKERYLEARRAGVSWITPEDVFDKIAKENKVAPQAPRSPASVVANGAPVNGNAGSPLPGVTKDKVNPNSILESFRAMQRGAPQAPFKRFGGG